MPLPKGFDPNNMSFDTVPINIPKKPTAYRNNYYTSSTTRRGPSLWERFNDTIEDIGNWFADHAESVLGTCTMLLMGLIGIGALILVIVTWVNQGLLKGDKTKRIKVEREKSGKALIYKGFEDDG